MAQRGALLGNCIIQKCINEPPPSPPCTFIYPNACVAILPSRTQHLRILRCVKHQAGSSNLFSNPFHLHAHLFHVLVQSRRDESSAVFSLISAFHMCIHHHNAYCISTPTHSQPAEPTVEQCRNLPKHHVNPFFKKPFNQTRPTCNTPFPNLPHQTILPTPTPTPTLTTSASPIFSRQAVQKHPSRNNSTF